jgi:GTP-binding protein HflX
MNDLSTNNSGDSRVMVICPFAHHVPTGRTPESRLEEAVSLAKSIDLEVVASSTCQLRNINPATRLGKGKVEEYREFIQQEHIPLVIVDDHLSPIQQRNLEKAWQCKVIDRTALILEIFGARAQTGEGKLQVKLAALQYQRSRLVRSWTHLERQRGGLGATGGPGETQLETDRRLIDEEVSRIKKGLAAVVRTRDLHRKQRQTVPYPVVALVGYTNAGKSTLFNRLTGAEVLSSSKLFATLDPTMRVVTLPSKRQIILSDTVGFISDLPTELVAAFRATLEEVIEATILIHLQDRSDPAWPQNRQDVITVLETLGVNVHDSTHIIEAYNKIDLCPDFIPNHDAIQLSAATGEGVEALLAAIEARLATSESIIEITLKTSDSKQLSWLYQHGTVLERQDGEEEIHVKVQLSHANLGRLRGV